VETRPFEKAQRNNTNEVCNIFTRLLYFLLPKCYKFNNCNWVANFFFTIITNI